MSIEVWTDGSCLKNPGPGGWAILFIHDGREWRISGGEPHTTNNKMELQAVIEALTFCQGDVTIHSDSTYVIKGATEWINSWKNNNWKTSSKKKVKNRKRWMKLHELQKNRNITWKWVKAHNGDKYNEIVDKLARYEATDAC